MAGLTIRNLTKSFGTTAALDDVTIEVAEGEFLAVLGPSGCGKTTLLRMIAGFESVTSGEIAIDGRTVSSPTAEVPPGDRKIGIVFQNYALWPHMNVADNIGYSLKVAKVAGPERTRRIQAALAIVDMESFADRDPASLSGGQRQRVALARCLVAEPKLVLFDEPLANLDVHLRASMETEFAAFHARTGTTILYITHDQAEAMALADRIAVMDHGRIMQLGPPDEIFHRPANEMVAGFISQGMVLPARVDTPATGGHCGVSVLGHAVTVRCREDDGPREGARICIRPSDIRLAKADAPGFDATIRRIIYQGGTARIEVRPDAEPGLPVRFEQPDPQPHAAGDRTRLAFCGGWLIPPGDGEGP